MLKVSAKEIGNIGDILCDAQKPLKQRFRALFTLKNVGGSLAVDCIARAFSDSSALLKHECAYCLGQMRDAHAIPALVSLLQDRSQEPMVRHEAGEALGAIGSPQVVDVLRKFENDPVVEVAETCQIALQRVRWLLSDTRSEEEKCLPPNPYSSVDPAPPTTITDVHKLKRILLDEKETLFQRYRAMFALRNLGGGTAAVALAAGLSTGSALFRHEVAYVLGQMQEVDSVPLLVQALEDTRQNEMVRHECAEALGSIADERCRAVLQRYLADDERVVRESCEVALDICDYENGETLQYADALCGSATASSTPLTNCE